MMGRIVMELWPSLVAHVWLALLYLVDSLCPQLVGRGQQNYLTLFSCSHHQLQMRLQLRDKVNFQPYVTVHTATVHLTKISQNTFHCRVPPNMKRECSSGFVVKTNEFFVGGRILFKCKATNPHTNRHGTANFAELLKRTFERQSLLHLKGHSLSAKHLPALFCTELQLDMKFARDPSREAIPIRADHSRRKPQSSSLPRFLRRCTAT